MARSDHTGDPRCADCGHSREVKACTQPTGKSPRLCPMAVSAEAVEAALQAYSDPGVAELARQASLQEADGYADRHARPWVRLPTKPRIQETWELAHRLGLRKVGLAFCGGLAAEAKVVARMLAAHGLEVVSVVCKVGAVPKETLGLSDADKVRPGGHESMCNPVAQARVLAEAETELNILLGLCVGHDSLFLQHSHAPCTVLAVKDRVTGHNPLAAVYASGVYYERLLEGA